MLVNKDYDETRITKTPLNPKHTSGRLYPFEAQWQYICHIATCAWPEGPEAKYFIIFPKMGIQRKCGTKIESFSNTRIIFNVKVNA